VDVVNIDKGPNRGGGGGVYSSKRYKIKLQNRSNSISKITGLLTLPTKARNIVFKFNIECSSLKDFGP